MIDIEGDDSEAALDSAVEKALRDFLDLCVKENIDNIIFVRYPHFVTKEEDNYERYQRNNRVGKIVESYGFDYLNMDHLLDEMNLNREEDFYNGEHMNARGMKKMTTWFGKYLMETYAIKPRTQTDDNRAKWEKSSVYMQALYNYFDKLQEKYSNKDVEVYENVSLMSGLTRFLEEE